MSADEERRAPVEGDALPGRLGREFRTMREMVGLYCQAHHAANGARPCPHCVAFLQYAAVRLDKCPYGEDKPTCANCPIHCYKKAPREFAREVMRYAGPRMMLRHPVLALLHLIDGRRKVAHPMEARRRSISFHWTSGAALAQFPSRPFRPRMASRSRRLPRRPRRHRPCRL